MNIREIEQQLGIPRANVRYYEKEGLLHPQRSANNYRIYTAGDVETLKKIRLLRQLDMPIETIRAVQAGEVALADALARQEHLLENEAVKLEQARSVCRSMLNDQVTYAALEPSRYEGGHLPLPGRTAERPEPKRPPVEGAVWALCPWQRYWARTFDLGLTCGIAGTVLSAVFHVSIVNTNPALLQTVQGVLGWMLLLVLEPLLLCTWGTTPGKRLLGLELRNAKGGKLRFAQGMRRTWEVLWVGYGFGIPIYSWYRLYRCYKECEENKPLDYDYAGDVLYYSTAPDSWGLRAAASVALSLLLIPAQVWFAFQAILPPNRGEITAAEFAENVNAVADHLGYSLWVNEDGLELARQTISIRVDDDDWTEHRYGEPFDDTPVYTVETDENGYVTAVCAAWENTFSGKDPGWAWLSTGRARIILIAFRGAWCSGYSALRGPIMEAMEMPEEAWDGHPIRDGRFTLTVALEQNGYQNVSFTGGSALLIPEDGAKICWYRFTLRLEKAQSTS